MSAEAPGGLPLRPRDPRHLGRYELLGRLGEGGMGAVYLARTPEGRRVALKIIKPELTHETEFRERFRSEVARAQDVPPFCTAEVLDADPDHDPPYLVAEYVPGPSLSAVVAEQGPLTPANLHALAIGVATALTAIHGAGVIHRDLKPSNILLSPGSPKVIDFGIARGMDGADVQTRTDQVLGTVAYMAPERFQPGSGRTITAAADVFAWGAVVMYAGTGRTPFTAATPYAVAARIMAGEPDLDGLDGPLRALVTDALAPDPAARPTARDLLDRLLSSRGASRASTVAAALNRQPELREAVAEARAATDHHPVRELTAQAAPVPLGPGVSSAPTVPSGQPVPAPPVRSAQPFPPGHTPGEPVFTPGDTAEPTYRLVPTGPAASGRAGRVATLVFAITTLLALLLLAGVIFRVVPFDRLQAARGTVNPAATSEAAATSPSDVPSDSPSADPTPTGSAGPSASATPSDVPVISVQVNDPLVREGYWSKIIDATNKATCEIDHGLVITKKSPGTYRCRGYQGRVADFEFRATTTLANPQSCAGVWFRFGAAAAADGQPAGYLLTACTSGLTLSTHGLPKSTNLTELTSFPQELRTGKEFAVGITARGADLEFSVDGRLVGAWHDTTFPSGRVVLGLQGAPDQTADPYSASVTFRDFHLRPIL